MTIHDRKIAGVLLATVSGAAILVASDAVANPQGPNVVAGQVAISTPDPNTLVVDNGSMRSIVNWDQFSIGVGETTTINQISHEAAILNRVVGGNISEIYGTLQSNGQVFLINESGILIGETGIIETAGFVASTLDVSNAEFLAGGDMVFKQGIETGGGITVHGKIRSVSGGDIFLLSREIEIGSTAVIDAGGGYVGLGAGEEILLRPADNGNGRIQIRAGKGRINNAGTIAGITAEIRAAGGNEYALAVNNTGVVRATGVSRRGGRVMLTGGGKVRNAGRIVARKRVVVRSQKRIINRGSIRAGTQEKGGEIVFEAPEIVVEAGSVLDVSGALGGGRMFLGGGFQGTSKSVSGDEIDIAENATSTVIEAGALLDASATESGDAGEIIVWSDNSTAFHGSVVAEAVDGAGGFAEISGKQTLNLAGFSVDLSGTTAAGTLLLDPDDIAVSDTTATGTNVILDSDIETLLEAGTSVTISTGLPGAGDNSSSATTTNPVGTVAGYADDADGTDEPGDVTFEAGVRIIWVDNDAGADTDTTFTVHAARDINALDDVIIEHTEVSDPVTLGYGAGGDDIFVDRAGGIVFIAGRDINIGSAAGRSGATPGVSIGSEFGTNLFVAGDTDFDSTVTSIDVEQAGDINVIGGNTSSAFAQIGYRQNTLRGNNTGHDFSAVGVRAVNGDINVFAGRHVNVTGTVATTDLAFAQIGHGGWRSGLQVSAEIASSRIQVYSGVAVTGNVTLTGGYSGEANQAQIGHGVTMNQGSGQLIQGDISGDIAVIAVLSDIVLNGFFTPTADGPADLDLVRAQIGHGATIQHSGQGEAGTEVTHGKISGDISVDASTDVVLGVNATTTATGQDRFWILSQIGHGGLTFLNPNQGSAITGDGVLEVSYDRIAEFDDISGAAVETTNISVIAGGTIVVRAQETAANSGGTTNSRLVDNLQRSQIGHGSFTAIDEAGNAQTVGTTHTQLDVSVTEGDIAGDITVTDDSDAAGGGNYGLPGGANGVLVSATITGTNDADTNFDAMIARIGHGTANFLEASDGGPSTGAGADGGSITIDQADILGARIRVETKGGDNTKDITVEASVTSVTDETVHDNTAVAQIGHSGDVFAQGGAGGAGASGSNISGDAGDIVVHRGTVWDGLVHDNSTGNLVTYGDNGGQLDDDYNSEDDGNTDILVLSSNRIVVDSDTSAADLAHSRRNNAEASIGHGHKLRLYTRDGGTGTNAASGGRGGDILVTLDGDLGTPGTQLVQRDFGDGSSTGTDDSVYGLRGEIVLAANETGGSADALSVTATNTAVNRGETDNNSTLATIGHGDVIEAQTGKGNDGGDANDPAANAQVESYGGRGGHVHIDLDDMRIESDIQLQPVDIRTLSTDNGGNPLLSDGIMGTVFIESVSANGTNASVGHDLVEAVIGHSQRMFAHAGDGGNGGTEDHLANSQSNLATEVGQNTFLVGFRQDGQDVNGAAGDGAARGGNGGDVSIEFGHITDRVRRAGDLEDPLRHDGEADIHVVATNNADDAQSVTVTARVVHSGDSTEGDTGEDLFAGIGHHTRAYGEGGIGAAGGSTLTAFDDFIQPTSSGGRGGDVGITTGNIIGDVVVDATRQVLVGHDGSAGNTGDNSYTKTIMTIGHTTDVVAVAQYGGHSNSLGDHATTDGGIDPHNTNLIIVLVDGNDDDEFNLADGADAGSFIDDGVDLDDTGAGLGNRDGFDGSGHYSFTQGSITYSTNRDPDDDNVTEKAIIRYDHDGDPEWLFTGGGGGDDWTPNVAFNLTTDADGMGDSTAFTTPLFVDLDPVASQAAARPRTADLVDFDKDGFFDIVDLDKDGIYDQIDGRSAKGSLTITGNSAGFNIMDYTVASGLAPDTSDGDPHLEGGWSLLNSISYPNAQTRHIYATADDPRDHGTAWTEDGNALIGDFSNANGGRGGDATTIVGYTIGDISVGTGDPDDVEDRLIVRSIISDEAISSGRERDISIARIGHGAFQFSDAGGSYARRVAGRVEVDRITSSGEGVQGHDRPFGGGGGNYAINGSGGRGGDATVIQGVTRDVDGSAGSSTETDHLVGNIFVNVDDNMLPTDLRIGRSGHNDSQRITVESRIPEEESSHTNLSIAQIGHGAVAAAAAGSWGGDNGTLIGNNVEGNNGNAGASEGGVLGGVTSSQTEVADGGRGGDAVLTQNQIKGAITVWAGTDEDGPSLAEPDFSVEVLAIGGQTNGVDNTIIAQIGHGRVAAATGGNGGDGDDGQYRGNGGRGGDATITQASILDTGITIDTVHVGISGITEFLGNGMLIRANHAGSNDQIVRAQVGLGDLAWAESGEGGDGAGPSGSLSDVSEQINQTVNGGRGGDVVINQHGYNYDITVDLGPNLDASEDALQVIADLDHTAGTWQHVLAALGHGGYALGVSDNGGDGGNRNADNDIESGYDPNRRTDVDATNRIFLGTDRNGGRGGDAIVNIGVQGTGRSLTTRGTFIIGTDEDGNAANDADDLLYHVGFNDPDGADITVTIHDNLASTGSAATDGVLVESRAGPGDTFTNALDTNTAIIGHTGFARANATGARGGNGIQSAANRSDTVSEGDGGDGGDATATIGFINGDISVDNTLDNTLSNAGNGNDVDIKVRAVDQSNSDSNLNIAEARIGHLVSGEAYSGAGGDAAREDGTVPNYPAYITARGGDGGDATSTQGQHYGAITITAENSIIVEAVDSSQSSETLWAAIGHRMESEAVAAVGGFGGTATQASTFQNLYFIYEALLEYARVYETRRNAGDAHAAAHTTTIASLSDFERKLIEPIVSDYYEDKHIQAFLEKMTAVAGITASGTVGSNLVANDRDDNSAGTLFNFTLGELTQEEQDTLLFLMAAAGDGGHATSTQGSTLTIGDDPETRSVSGNITLNALSRDTGDTARGILVSARDGSTASAFEVAHVGHQAVVITTVAGDGQDIAAYDDAMGGDGGDARVTQYAFDGRVRLDSEHKITIESSDGTLGVARQRAFVGHRLAIGHDRPDAGGTVTTPDGAGGTTNVTLANYRPDNEVVVRAGEGGSETANEAIGYNGNGGDVTVVQAGINTNNTDADIDVVLIADQQAGDEISVRILASSTGLGSQEAETHIGHDMVLVGAKAGDAGRQWSQHSPVGLDEGVLEGNGGDIRISQGDIGADIDITGRDDVDIDATTANGPNDAHVIIGHERTIGEVADTHNDAASREGTIIAGFGGDSVIEDYNDTALINPISLDAGTIDPVTNSTVIEDADAGVIYITHGNLRDSQADMYADPDAEVVTITSLDGEVLINSTTGDGGRSFVEIGNAQHVHAQTLNASLDVDALDAHTAGDGGSIRISRGTISGGILIQALDQDGTGAGGDDEGVELVATTGTGATSQIYVGHETEFNISTRADGTGTSDQSSGFGTTVYATLRAAMVALIDELNGSGGRTRAGTGVDEDVTVADAMDALVMMRNAVRVIDMAVQNAGRYSTTDQTTLNTALTNAKTALADAETAFAVARAGNTPTTPSPTAEHNFVNEIIDPSAGVNGYLERVLAALDLAESTIDDAQTESASLGPSSLEADQLADHADAGGIWYTATDALASLNSTATIGTEGLVTGNVRLISGRDTPDPSTPDGVADTFDTGHIVIDASPSGTGGTREVELGHRRTMTNVTGEGGGDTDASPEDGGVAGDGGSILIGDDSDVDIGDLAQDDARTGNRTSGDVSLTADEVMILSGGNGTSDAHLGHDVFVTNTAGKSDIGDRMGNGGRIETGQTVSGSVSVTANHITSDEDNEDSVLRSQDAATSFTHLGHEVDTENTSDSEADSDDANRGGAIIARQDTGGDVAINLDLDNDNNPNDLTIEAVGSNSRTRLGHEVNNDAGATSNFISGHSDDDGAEVTVSQTTSGNIRITEVEDLLITSDDGQDVFVGHDAVLFAQSGQTGQTDDEFGQLVDTDQTITGTIGFGSTMQPLRTFNLVEAAIGDAHVGHEGRLTARSADDRATPPAGDGTSQRDVDADQLIQAEINVWAGEIWIRNAADGVAQLGHEAFITVDTDGTHAQAHSRSFINPADTTTDLDDITLVTTLTGLPGNDDTSLTAGTGLDATVLADGDIEIRNGGVGLAEVGHRSISTVSHAIGTPPSSIFDTLHAIGGQRDGAATDLIVLNADGTVANTASSTITIDAARDLEIVNGGSGDSQIGHYISEERGNLHGTNMVRPTSLVRQVVGSDIVIGDGTPDSTTGVGNNLVVSTSSGAAQIGHRSPSSNDWQGTTGGALVTPQILDGDIIIEVGVDAGSPSLARTAAAPGDTAAGGDDDALITGDDAKIGHNHTDVGEASDNEVQVSGGDIWLRVRGDLEVKDADIGHEHYNHGSTAIDTNNAIEGAGTVRNRIRGLTTIGAGQSVPTEDSQTLADVMKFDNANINSGYSDVGGQLRFYIPAQENLTTTAGTSFNDSDVGGDPVNPRTSSPDNIFLGPGGGVAGLDHENGFRLMGTIPVGTSNQYTTIGTANFAFYFGVVETTTMAPVPDSIEFPIYTPYINFIDLENGFRVVFEDSETGSTVNVDFLGDNIVVGTSSFDVACQEAGLSEEMCEDISIAYQGQTNGFGSNVLFSATPGGNQVFGTVENINGSQNPSGSESSSVPYTFGAVEPAVAGRSGPANGGVLIGSLWAHSAASTAANGEQIIVGRQSGMQHFAVHVPEQHRPQSPLEDSYGEYVENADIAVSQIYSAFGPPISYSTSYEVFAAPAPDGSGSTDTEQTLSLDSTVGIYVEGEERAEKQVMGSYGGTLGHALSYGVFAKPPKTL